MMRSFKVIIEWVLKGRPVFSRLLHNKDKEKLSTPDIMELKAYVNLSETYIYDLKMSFSLP